MIAYDCPELQARSRNTICEKLPEKCDPNGKSSVDTGKETEMGAKKSPDQRKHTHVTFNATDEERELFSKAARATGLSSRTDWMRSVLIPAARKALKENHASD